MDSKLQLWQQCKLKDVAYLHKDQVNPVVLGDILIHHYSIPAFDEGQVPKQESAENIKSNKFSVPPDAVLLSKLNPRFPRVWLPQIDPTIKSLASTEFLILRPQANTDRRFLKFLCSEPVFMSKLLERVTGTSSSHQRVRPDDVLTIEVDIPPLPEQYAIAAILGALDDKIELNRQMNKTLEAMAQALFKSWFVDFETFRDQGMQDSPLGPIPRGWRVGKLNNIASFVKGVSYRSDDLQESTVALVTLKSVARGGGYQQEGLKPYIGEYKPEQQLQPGELIVAHTDLTQAAEVLGRTARVQAHSQFPTLVASLDLVIVRPMGQATSNEFLYSMLSRSEFQEHAYGYANGTTVLHLSAKALPEYQCILPPPTIIEAFTRLVRPIYERIDYNEAQSHTLASTRDTLLPKLLSGELRVVKDAEKFVEKAI